MLGFAGSPLARARACSRSSTRCASFENFAAANVWRMATAKMAVATALKGSTPTLVANSPASDWSAPEGYVSSARGIWMWDCVTSCCIVRCS